MKNLLSIEDIALSNLTVFLRVDFNVPLDNNFKIADTTRIDAAIPTIQYLLSHNAKVILASHLGRPDGQRDDQYSLKHLIDYLRKVIKAPFFFAPEAIGQDTERLISSAPPASVVLLENLRFYPGEESNDPVFAQELAKNVDVYVNDAFGTAHRAHASTEGITKFVRVCAAGYLMNKEVHYLSMAMSSSMHPFTVILGGAKVSDKIKVIDSFLDRADNILIGGAMAYTFALAQGKTTGKSPVEPDFVDFAKKALKKAADKNIQFLLPLDTIVTKELKFKERIMGQTKVVDGSIPDGWQGVDIGPRTVELYAKVIKGSKTVLWNGPMGIFEIDAANKGTYAMAKAIADSSAISIIGGGDSVKAINNSGYSHQVTFISTGGGASLEFLEGKNLPGITPLYRKG